MSIKQMTLTERECKKVGGFFKEGVCSIPEENVSVERNITLALSHKEGLDNYVFSIKYIGYPLSTQPGGEFSFNATSSGVFKFKHAITDEDLKTVLYFSDDINTLTRRLAGRELIK